MARKQSNPRKSSQPGPPRQGRETMSAQIGPFRGPPSFRQMLRDLAAAGYRGCTTQNEVARTLIYEGSKRDPEAKKVVK